MENRFQALALARSLEATPANMSRVAKATDAESARWAFAQWELRHRARAKFSRADEMFFVREALEQATHERVAEYHASRFPAGALVVDMTSGIGADLIALAKRGPAWGYELSAERAGYARQNLEALGLVAEVREEDSVVAGWAAEYAFCDPARRVEGRRTLDLDEFSPPPREVAARFTKLRRGILKLSPMLPDQVLESLGTRVEFVSFGGECREALVYAGSDVEAGRFAVHVESGEELAAGEAIRSVEQPMEFLFDADPAAVRAHALGSLGQGLGIVGLGDSNGYFTGRDALRSPWLRSYRVLYSGKADVKATRKALRELEAATPEIKQRGAGLDLLRERKEYAMPGKRAVSLVVWPVGRSLRHAIVERI